VQGSTTQQGGKTSTQPNKAAKHPLETKATRRQSIRQATTETTQRSRQGERRQAQMWTFSKENRQPPPAELPTTPPERERRHRRRRRPTKKVKAFIRKAHQRGGGEGQK